MFSFVSDTLKTRRCKRILKSCQDWLTQNKPIVKQFKMIEQKQLSTPTTKNHQKVNTKEDGMHQQAIKCVVL